MSFKATISKVMKEIFLDTKGKLSSKRTITFVAFALVCIAFIANLVFQLPLEEFVYEGMIYIVLGGAGFSAMEHFSPGTAGNTKTIDQSKHFVVGSPELLED